MKQNADKSDITSLIRTDINRRDWNRMHVIADRRQPFMLEHGRMRVRDGISVIVRSQVG